MQAQDAQNAGLKGSGAADSVLPAGWGEVVINEVMADPYPPIRYEEEYLELFNRSGREINLENWVLLVNTRSYTLTQALMPGGLLLAPGAFGVILDLTLPNGGATLCLYDSGGQIVHAARYGVPWDGADWKKEGGWALESPDPEQFCNISDLWEYSSDPAGGSPGRINSQDAVLEDRESPVLLYAGFDDQANVHSEGEPGLLRIHFSEPVVLSPEELQQIALIPGNLSPQEAHLLPPLSTVLELRFPVDLQERHIFRVKIPQLSDCMGNESLSLEALAGSVSDLVPGSVLINEIMYDPIQGHPEYIELVLPGNRFYDLGELAIHVVDLGDPADDPVPLSDHPRLMTPGSYLVLTSCMEHLRESYDLSRSGQWVEAKGMKALNKGGGSIFLTDRAGNVVDRADYGDHLHAQILTDTRGISLERISRERSGIDPGNWHSAAAIEGYATPGRINSQALSEAASDQLLGVYPEVFSPDNDGFQDLLELSVSTGASGWVLSLWITDLEGNLLRKPANNHLAGPLTTYTWDGTSEDGSMVAPGIYVVHAVGYHPPSGGRWIRKRAVGVVYR